MPNPKEKGSSRKASPPKRAFVARFPIVGIGASAGGLEAFTELLKHLAIDTGLGFVLVQHLDPQHESALTQILARATSMPVLEVTDNLRVRPNHVYVIPPNKNLLISHGILKLQRRKAGGGTHRSIDFFFESLAQDQQECAIGIVLSGTATDGTLGLEMIKSEGGVAFAQDKSAKYDSMPRNAVAAGCVDFELSPTDIARELGRIAKHPLIPNGRAISKSGGIPKAKTLSSSQNNPEAVQITDDEHGFRKILLSLRNHRGVDFSLYKPSTIERRITRRMVLNQKSTLGDYAQFLKGNSKELDLLYSDVLIGVTSFFRNPEAFDVLKSKVFPELLRHSRHQNPVRVWTLACSSGQEAYSIAIAYTEHCDNIPRAPKLQIFATDLNDAMLDRARRGLYAQNLVADISPDRLRRFFVAEEGGYRVCKALRDLCVFARQNLLSDPPFSRMDLISCRNLLIYIEPGLQKRILPNFHYALKADGFLFLGASESIGTFTNLFEPADKKQKIFTKKSTITPSYHLPISDDHPMGKKGPAATKQEKLLNGFGLELNAQREADRLLSQRFAPACVLINAQMEVLQFRGPTGTFLEPPKGKASFNVLKMARDGLMLPLRTAINKAKKENKTARKENVRINQDGAADTVNLEVIPLKNLGESCFLILFEHGKGRRGPGGETFSTSTEPLSRPKVYRPSNPKEESGRIRTLEHELSETREYLQSIQEQHEAADEELQASNEEVQSANEELQSINEELETSKEELESTNEELTTVNEEMTNRNVELNRLNADLNNLQTSTKLPVLLLGRDLTIRRFSPPAEKIFNLLATDVGRSLGNIRHNLIIPAVPTESTRRRTDSPQQAFPLDDLVREVIDNVREQEREVRDKEGVWYSLRVRPYMTLDSKVDGAVLVLVDIDKLKRTERAMKSARDYAEATIRTARDPLVVLRVNLQINTANEAFYKVFKTKPEQTEGCSIFDVCGRAWRSPKLRELLEDILPRNSFFNDFELTRDFPRLGRRNMLLNARRLELEDGSPPLILLSIEDVTERQRASEATAKLAAIVQTIDGAVFSETLEGVITSWNPGAERMLGYNAHEIIGKNIRMLIPSAHPAEADQIFEQLRRGERVTNFEMELLRKNGSTVWVLLNGSPLLDHTGLLVGGAVIARDITERKDRTERMRISEIRYRRLFEAAHNGVLIVDSVSRKITQANPFIADLLGYTPEELLGKELWEIGLLKDEQASHSAFRELQHRGLIRYEDLPLETKIGEKREVEVVANVYEENGKQVIQCNIRDITDRKRAIAALRHSEERFRALFDLVPVGVYSCDASGTLQEFNRRAVELWGRTPKAGDSEERFCGSFKLYRSSGEFMPHEKCPMADVLSGKIPAVNDTEVIIERPDGSRITTIVNIVPLKNAQGEVTGAINCILNITERIVAEKELERAHAQLANRANQLEGAVTERTKQLQETVAHLEAFSYSIVHDMRAPLRAMQSFAQILEDECSPQISDTGKDYIHRIARSANRLDKLILDVLTYSRTARTELTLVPVNLNDLLRGVLESYPLFQNPHSEIEVIGPLDDVIGNEAALTQCLSNLIGNAVKFVSSGTTPHIRIWTERRESRVKLFIADNGVGIEKDAQQKIFGVFQRQSNEYEGTGIGLAIVQKAMERMGGEFGLKSELGEGSTFWLDLASADTEGKHAN